MVEFRKLFNTIIAFKESSPWDCFQNADIFAIENPETKQIGYCCIMGAGGETFGIAVYLGQYGWHWLSDRLQDIPLDLFSQFMQNCISVTFENAGELDPGDKQLIKNLGLKFRGKLSYPLLRRYSPGMLPAMVNESEAAFLNLALEQTMFLAPEIKKNPDYLFSAKGDILLRKVSEDKKGWIDQWINPDNQFDPVIPNITLISQNIKQISEIDKKKQTKWIADMFFLPEPIVEKKGSEPFFPLVLIFINKRNGIILNFRISRYNNFRENLTELFFESVKTFNIIPGFIETTRSEIFSALAPLQKSLDLRLEHRDSIEELEQMQEEFMLHFFNSMPPEL
ncbi:MAG TPA: hypothetical protein VHO03_08400 [Ignavibacteriales bacterium]|nr:hypothetical protein [Ignavibacteriales bacterium]